MPSEPTDPPAPADITASSRSVLAAAQELVAIDELRAQLLRGLQLSLEALPGWTAREPPQAPLAPP